MDKVIQIYNILKKRRYNRDTPYLENDLINRLRNFVNGNKPIKLVGFWGVGSKEEANLADVASCEFLAQLNEDIKKIYAPGIQFTFIFATLHGIHNGISKRVMSSYLSDIKILFKKFGFKFLDLEPLWKKYQISFKKINQILNAKKGNWWSQIENVAQIEKNAKNRNRRLGARIGAQKYYIMRDLEKKMLEQEFADSIFHAFSDTKLRNVLPNMPTLYFYARKGWSDTPWFITEK